MVRSVHVVILHPGEPAGEGPLSAVVAAARRDLAERHRAGFLAAGATTAEIVSDPRGARPFGARLRTVVERLGQDGGLVILGSGAIPLATRADRRRFVAAAAMDRPGALANNRYSADIIAVARARPTLGPVPDIATDNALPRWLAEVAGVPVDDLRRRWRLGVDIDGPLDLILLGGPWARRLTSEMRTPVEDRLTAIRTVTRDPGAELMVTGRTSAAGLRWLETATVARTRALVEERGMRTASPGQRPAASVLGLLLERDGPTSLGSHLARLGDAAVVDSRVLLAHRCGPDPVAWPDVEDRAASDLLLPERVADPWLRELTASAVEAPIPVILGGHTLVGPGLRLALRPTAARA